VNGENLVAFHIIIVPSYQIVTATEPFEHVGFDDLALAYWSVAVQTVGVDDNVNWFGGSILPGVFT
jgi:hypothetical protein